MKRCLVLFFIVVLGVSGSRAEVKIEDSFGTSVSRKAGDALNGVRPEMGMDAWSATGNLHFVDDSGKGAIASGNIAPFVGKVPLPATGNIIVISAKLHPKVAGSGTEKSNWVAIGLGDNDEGRFLWNKGVFLLVNSSGQYEVFANYQPKGEPPTIRIPGGSVENYNPEGMNEVKMEYNRKKMTLSIWVSGVAVVEDFGFEGKDFVPDTTYAGFSGFQQEPEVPIITDFSAVVK